ncbi:MAG: hypothetical protein EBY24_21810, partial [Betaproteobacteria bacterium]|nr:hypothetical protein [Betaproteobacteria bacterium]
PAATLVMKGTVATSLRVHGVFFGVKARDFYIAVCDMDSGTLLGVVELSHAYKKRTAASAVVAAGFFAPAAARRVAVIGSGAIATEVVRLLPTRFALDSIRVASRTHEGARAFVHRLQPQLACPLQAVASVEQAVEGADIVVTITNSNEPFIHAGMLERGSFRPLTNPMLDMLDRAQEQFVREASLQGEPPVVMFEMTLRQLQVGNAIDHRDFLDRVDTLGALGKPVLISNFLRYHRLVSYLSRQTQRPIGLPIGLVRLRDVLDEKFYTDLPGGLMESLGQLFKNGAKLYVYPSLDKKTGKITTIENLEVMPHLRHLFAHLVENRFIENITSYNAGALNIYSSEVLAKIHSGDESLSRLIPAPIFERIKAKQLFGWKQKVPVAAQ